MKCLFIAAIFLFSCNSREGNPAASASDTMTHVTNPGVGAASDDTTLTKKAP